MPETRINTLEIRTAEGVAFSLPLAGPFTRFLAKGIDFACISAVNWMASMLIGGLAHIGAGLYTALMVLIFFISGLGYCILCEWLWRGQTVGKRLLGLRVMDERGLRLRFSQVAIRNLMRAVDAMPMFYAVGGCACVISRRCQRLGDYLAGTIVVRHVREPELDVSIIKEGKFNSFRHHPHIEARLRQRITPEEIAMVFEAVLRRDEFDPEARVVLFKELADHLRTLAQFPEEATFALTDEQYVRNAVASLYAGRKATDHSSGG